MAQHRLPCYGDQTVVAGVLQGNEPKLTERGCAAQTDYGFSPVLILQRLRRNANLNLIFSSSLVAHNIKDNFILMHGKRGTKKMTELQQCHVPARNPVLIIIMVIIQNSSML